MASVSGFAGTVTDIAGGNKSWSNTTNAVGDSNDGSYANSANFSSADVFGETTLTNYLQFSNFGFTIPSGATIDGIIITTEPGSQRVTGTNGGTIIATNMRLRYNSTYIGTNPLTGTDSYQCTSGQTTTTGTLTKGSSSNTLGATLTDTIVNSSSFGFAIQMNCSAIVDGTIRALLDYGQITVYYTELPAGSGFNQDITDDINYQVYSDSPVQVVPNDKYTNLTISDDTSSATYIDWEFKRLDSPSTDISFRVNSNGSLNGITANSTPLVEKATLSTLSIALNRQFNWYVRYKLSNGDWSAWTLLDISGEIRIMGGRHRDVFTFDKSSAGTTVNPTTPLFSFSKTATGTRVVKNRYSRRNSRNF